MKIELCAGTIKAIEFSATDDRIHRIELCQNLELGGITPSKGMIAFALEKNVEAHVLIRPRPGGFCYSKNEIQIMLNNISLCKELGVKGVVVGALHEDKSIDENTLQCVLERGEGLDFTFHRAFDDSPNWKKNVELLVKLGFKRILTSGLSSSVDKGLATLQKMQEFAGNAIEVMPGGGINSGNVVKIMRTMHPDSIHFSGTKQKNIDENSIFGTSVLELDEGRVDRIFAAIDQA